MPITVQTVNLTDVLEGEDRITLDTIIAEEAILRTETLSTVTPSNKVITQADMSAYGGGDMVKAVYDTNDDGQVDAADDADTVNGLTVLTAVPAGAIFTDTTDHTLLINVGTHTHPQIDTHIDDTTIHFTQGAISITESQISDFGSYEPVDTNILRQSDALTTPVDATNKLITEDDLAALNLDDEVIEVSTYANLPVTGVSEVVYIVADEDTTYRWTGSGYNSIGGGGVTDHTLLTNIGTNSHAQIDTHIADTTKHFTEGSINHTNILNIGTNTHAQIDSHIADSTIHFTQASISITESQISDLGPYIPTTHPANSLTAGDLIDIGNLSGINTGDQVSSDFTHDDLIGFVANEHIDWTITGIEDIHADRYTNTTDHTLLSNIGTNTHTQIDTHIATSNIHFTEASINHTNILNVGTNSHAQIDTHIADGTKHFTEGSIDHTNILNIGTNTHAQIDSHIANTTSNPHNVDKTDVGLSNVDNTADAVKVVASANELTTARSISLSGDATGTIPFDGSADVTIPVVITDDSHNHIIANIDGLQAELDSKADSDALGNLNELFSDTNEPSGFVREAPNTMGIMEYSEDGTNYHRIDQFGDYTYHTSQTNFGDGTTPVASRKFVIYPVSGNTLDVYIEGQKNNLTATKSVTIAATSGMHYLYFDETAVLNTGTTFSYDYFEENPVVAFIYVNTVTDNLVEFADERHGVSMDGATHRYLHFTHGCQYVSGMGVTGFVEDGTTHGQLDAGVMYDEDIFVNVGNQSTAPFWYINNTTWDRTTASNLLAFTDTGDTLIAWNSETGGVWSLVEASQANDCFVVFLVATNNAEHHFVKIVPQASFSSVSTARAGIEDEINNLVLAGLPASEFLLVGAYIVNGSGELQLQEDGSIYLDLRQSNIATSAGASGVVNDHYTLANIGSYTHYDIDDHINDTTVHFTQASISITESQISDLQNYALDTHTHSTYDRSVADLSGATVFDNIAVTNGIVTAVATRDLTAGDIGAATSAHTHSTYDYSAVALTGATVFSDINVLDGIVTGEITTRELTAGDIGAATSAHTHSTYDYNAVALTGATVFSDINVLDGIVTGEITTRALTLSDLGFTGATDADNYASWTIKGDGATTYPITSGDTLNIIGGTDISVTATADDTLTVAFTGTTGDANQNAFSNVAVSGQTTVAADTTTDTLTLVAGTNVTITTDAGADSVTINATGSGGIGEYISSSIAIGADGLALNDDDGTDNNNIGIGNSAGANVTTGAWNILLGDFAGEGAVAGFTGTNNFAAGEQALRDATSATSNIAIGYQTLENITSGGNNIALGDWAMQGDGVTAVTAAQNIALGNGALNEITSGQHNIIMGNDAASHLESGNYNIGIGYKVLLGESTSTNLTGEYNIALGYFAGEFFSTAQRNVAIGYAAGELVQTADDGIYIGKAAGYGTGTSSGNENIFMGLNAGYDFTTATRTVAIGTNAGANITTSDTSVAIGYNALAGDGITAVTGNNNIAIGQEAGIDITTGANNVCIGVFAAEELTSGSSNVFIGEGYRWDGGSVTGDDNVCIGSLAGTELTSGNYNVCMGYYAGEYLSSGADNIAIGSQALRGTASGSGPTGSNNIAIGEMAGWEITTGFNNIMIGEESGANVNTGSLNVGLGYRSLGGETTTGVTGNSNICVGISAGGNLTSGQHNVFIGDQMGMGVSTGSNLLKIGGGQYNHTTIDADMGTTPNFTINTDTFNIERYTNSDAVLPINLCGDQATATNDVVEINFQNNTTGSPVEVSSLTVDGNGLMTYDHGIVAQSVTTTASVQVGGIVQFDTLYDNGTKSTSWTMTLTNGQYQKVTMSGNQTLTITPPTGKPCTVYLHITQSGAGNTLTLPTGMWEGGTTGANTETDAALDILMIHYTGSAYIYNYMNDVS